MADISQQQDAPDVQGVLSRLFSGAVGNADQSLKNLATGVSGANDIAKANNEKSRNFYENYNLGGNLPLLGMAAGIGKSVGNGQTLGNAFEGYGSGLLKQKDFEFDRQAKLQALQDAQAKLARSAAEDQFNMSFGQPLAMIPAIGGAMGPMADARLFGRAPGGVGSPTQAKAGIGAPGGIESSPLPPPMPQGGGMPPVGGGAPAMQAQAPAGAAPREIPLPQAAQILQAYQADPTKYTAPEDIALVQQAWGVARRALATQQQSAGSLDADTLPRARAIIQDANQNPGNYLGAQGKDLLKAARETVDKSATFAGEKAGSEANAKLPAEIAKSNSEKSYTTQDKAKTDAFNDAQQGLTAYQQAQAMMDSMFDPKTGKPMINSGPLGPHFSHVAGVLEQVLGPKVAKMFTGTDPNNAQELEKLKTAMGTEIAKQTIGPGSQLRVAEFNQFLKTTPSDELLPKAFKWIVENTIAPKAKLQMDRYEAIKDLDPGQHNIQGALFDFDKKNPWYKPGASGTGRQGASTPPPASTITADAARAELARRRASAGAQ